MDRQNIGLSLVNRKEKNLEIITVRVYDEDMKTEIAQMKPYLFDQLGHYGRIFYVKYFPNDTSTIYSGGWNKTIMIQEHAKYQIQYMD